MNELFIKIDGEFYRIHSLTTSIHPYDHGKIGRVCFYDPSSREENVISLGLANKLGIYKQDFVKTKV